MHPELSDLNAEADLVGAVLVDEIAYIESGLKPEDFSIYRYRWFWEACQTIHAAGDHIDRESLARELTRTGHLEDVTGGDITFLYIGGSIFHRMANARRIRELAIRRRLVTEHEEQVRRLFNLDLPLPEAAQPIKTRWTPAELAATDFPEPACPIPGLIPLGLTVLGGRPKRGKSWLMMQAGCALALGGKFLERDLQAGRVLYYALEDPASRLKERTAKLGIPATREIAFERALSPLYLNGLAEIEGELCKDDYAMVVIDTLRRAMPGKDFNKDAAIFDDVFSKLQVLAGKQRLSIVGILHTRKVSAGFDPDPVEDVLGSTALTTSADCVLALYTQQGKKGATLKGRARDLEDIDLALEFDPLTCCWQSLGESGEVQVRQSEQEILHALEDLGKATVSTIARMINKDFSNTRRRVAELWAKGKIKKELIENKSFYYLPNKEGSTNLS
jgi:hypothetical protein